ncbi:CyP450 monooxygenase [Lenzites betulinus]|nr:CyP450 monooxygenase [Lenzites betulinus]
MIFWLCAVLFLVIIWRRRPTGRQSLPPGPPSLPVIGNALHFPTTNIPQRFHELAARYGKIISLSVLGNAVIVLDSYEVACELLEKRARIYSDRPDSTMVQMTALAGFNLPVMRYGQGWRQQRRIFHQHLQSNLVHTCYRPHIEQATHDLLLNLLDAPEGFSNHIHHLFAASVLSLGYGIKIARDDDHYAEMLRNAMKVLEAAIIPGKYLVEILPVLRYLPSWFPGTEFRRDATYVREKMSHAKHLLYEHGKSLLDSDPELGGDHSMLASMLRRFGNLQLDGIATKEDETCIIGALLSVYIAGSDTTVASLRAFFLAMAMTPDVQRKAQAELDAVVGRSRLPNLDDRDGLPYINAVVKELTRWNVVAPIGLPHSCLEDDVYDGYFIPKGSVVIANLWAFSRDPRYYPDPETFDPERFFKDGKCYPGARDPSSYIFGLGRSRICPGRHLAETSLFLACASTLHAFKISPPLDANGHPVKLEPRVETGLIIAHPKEFDCIIEPRWDGAADLIRA